MDIAKYRVIAHRGIHIDGTEFCENSIPAFELAVKNNLGVELDVHLTKDEKLVVVHDSNLKRLTGENVIVEDSTLEEIKKLNILGTKNKIPTFDEVLLVINKKVPMIIEIKNEGRAGRLENILDDTLKKYQGEYIIESFNPLSLLWFKKHDKNISRGQLSAKKIDRTSSVLNFFLSHMVFNIFTKPQFIAYKICDITKEMYEKCNKKGVYLIAWTLENIDDYYNYNKICDGFIFDNYDKLKDVVGENYEKKKG